MSESSNVMVYSSQDSVKGEDGRPLRAVSPPLFAWMKSRVGQIERLRKTVDPLLAQSIERPHEPSSLSPEWLRACPESIKNEQWTPAAQLAVAFGRPEWVWALAPKADCRVSAFDGEETLLMAAAAQTDSLLVDELIPFADVSAVDAKGESALHRVARSLGRQKHAADIADLLLAAGALASQKSDVDGKTPLAIAIGGGRWDFAQKVAPFAAVEDLQTALDWLTAPPQDPPEYVMSVVRRGSVIHELGVFEVADPLVWSFSKENQKNEMICALEASLLHAETTRASEESANSAGAPATPRRARSL